MATRSTIALEFADGTVQQVYCHWDGYLSGVGRILFNHYQDPGKLRELIDLGDLSSLGAVIGRQHDFDSAFKWAAPEHQAEMDRRQGICRFYGRDHGETGCEAREFADYADYRKRAQFEEYNYILRKDGHWYVEFYGQFDGLLKPALEQAL